MTVDIATLAIRVDSNEAQGATQDLNNLRQAGGRAEETTNGLTGAARKLQDVLKAVAAAAAAVKLYEYIKEATLLASRYNELGIVMGVVGRNAGYMRKDMDQTETALRKTGISAIESRNSIAKLISANIDLSKATGLARLAQDAAVIGGMNSSAAFESLVGGIQSAQVETLRTLGLNVNFEKSYDKLGKTLGKNAKDLTENEKTLARVNAVMELAPTIAGAYEGSLTNAGKQLRSMTRYVEDLKVQLGQPFQNPFEGLIDGGTKALKFALEHVNEIRAVIDSLIAAIVPGMKIAAAYFAIFMAGPAILAAVTAFFTPLIGAVALYTMNVMIGQTQTIYFNRTLFGMSVSAQLAAGSLSRLMLAGSVLFAAFAGWQIGDYLRENFVEARVAGLAFVGAIVKGWEHVKYGAEMMVAGIKFGWTSSINIMKAAFGEFISLTAKGMSLVGATEAGAQMQAYADGLTKGAREQKTFAESTAGIAAAHEKAVEAIDANIQGLVDYELAETKVTAAEEAAVKTKKVVVGLTDAQKKAYQDAVKSAREFITALQIERSEVGLAADQIKMMSAARAAAKAPTADLRMEIMKEALALDIATKAAAEKVAVDKIMADAQNDSDAVISSINDETKALLLKLKTYGMLPQAVTAMQIAELTASKQSSVLTDAGIADIDRRIEALKALGDAQFGVSAMNEGYEKQKKIWESIDRTAHDTFVSIFDSGKNAFDRLRDTLKNGLLDLLYQMTIKKWIFNISASVTGSGVAGAAQAAGVDASGGGIMGLLSAVKSAYTAISTGFAGISSSVASGVQSVMGQTGLVSQGAAPGALANGAGAVAGYAAGAAVGVYGGRAVSNGFSAVGNSGNTLVNVGTIAGAIIAGPIGAAIGGLLGGAANRLFGRKAREYGDSTINGSFGTNGFSGSTDTPWVEKGGTFRSSKRDTQRDKIDAATAQVFTSGYESIKAASADFATVLGVNADALKTRSQSLSIKLGKDQAANEAAIAKFFTNVGDKIAKELLPTIASFAKGTESASATLQRIAVDYAFVDVALEAIGKTFGAVGVGSVAAREHLIELAGGLEAFGQGTAFFAQNFLSEAERLAPVSAALKKSLAEMGYAFVDTREEFKSVVMGLDPSKAGDAEKLAGLFKVQAAFAQIYPAAEAAGDALQELVDLQREYDELTMTSAQLIKKQRDALAPANRAMFDQVQSVRALKDAQDAAKSSLGGVIDRMKGFGDSASALKSTLMTGSLSTLTPGQQYEELRRQVESTKAAAFGGDVKAQGNFNSIATAFLTASQKINGGDSLYSADREGVLKTIDEITKWTGGQIDVAQASLDAQEGQLAALIQLNATMTMIASGVSPGGPGALVGKLDRDWNRTGTLDMAPLAAEIRTLNAKLEAQTIVIERLGAEQAKQTGALITSNELIQTRAATTIVDGVTAGVRPKITAKNTSGGLE